MEDNIKYVIQELRNKIQDRKDNGPINMTADDLWKYSGKIEPYNEEYAHLMQEERERKSFLRYYKKRIKKRNIYLLLNACESRIIDYFYRTCQNLTTVQMAKDLGHCKVYVSNIISKHLKIQKNDKNNTGELP
jgi:CRISPR/Cas system endoribonuclease Cas6 (RAMP superfamily)